MSYYQAGTISVVAGGTSMTGTGTAFLANVKPGDTLCLAGQAVPVASVESNTALTLAFAWPGSTASAQAGYAITRTGAAWHSTVTANERLTEIINRLDAGQGLRPDATGTLAQRAAHDGEAQGFIYVRTDVTPFEIYIKASGDDEDWAGPSDLQGEDGDDGATVSEVLIALGVPAIVFSTEDPSGTADEGTLWLKLAS